MIKRNFSLLILFFLLFTLVNCNNSIFEHTITNESIRVELIIPQSRGSIDVNEYPIVEATITLTAPDNTQESQTWVTGEDTTLIFQNKGSGVYAILVLEIDEAGNEASYGTTFTVIDGQNITLTVHLGGNIYIDVDTDDSPTLTEYQVIPTYGANDWESFVIGTDTYLALANASNGSTNNIDSRIYQWDGSQFIEIQAIPTHSGDNWEALSFGSDTFLFITNNHNDSTYNLDSRLYQWDGSQFNEIQAIPTIGAKNCETLIIDSTAFFAIANGRGHSGYNFDSVIYKLEW